MAARPVREVREVAPQQGFSFATVALAGEAAPGEAVQVGRRRRLQFAKAFHVLGRQTAIVQGSSSVTPSAKVVDPEYLGEHNTASFSKLAGIVPAQRAESNCRPIGTACQHPSRASSLEHAWRLAEI